MHQEKFVWLGQFLLSLDRASLESGVGVCEVYLLLTSAKDHHFFKRLCDTLQLNYDVHFIGIRTEVDRIPDLQGLGARMDADGIRQWAVFKKLCGLYILALDDAEDVLNVCIDSDTLCLKWDQDFAARVNRNYEDGRFFGPSVEAGSIFDVIASVSTKLYDGSAAGEAIAGIKDAKTYTWFFEVPIYGSRDLAGFLEFSAKTHGGLLAFFNAINPRTFEHTAFSYYMQGVGCSVQNYDALSSRIPEHLRVEDLVKIVEEYRYTPLWLTSRAFAGNVALAKQTVDPYLLSHIDRWT